MQQSQQSPLWQLLPRRKPQGEAVTLPGATPSLLLPLVVFMGVHEYSIARGAALAFTLGYLLDIFAAAPVGLFTFITVATFIVSRAAGVRLAAQSVPAALSNQTLAVRTRGGAVSWSGASFDAKTMRVASVIEVSSRTT